MMSLRRFKKRGCRYWVNLGVFALVTIFIGLLFLQFVGHPYFLSKGWAHPNSPGVYCSSPADYGWDYEDVSFTTRDGLTLQGWYIPSRNEAALILAHSIGSNRVSMLPLADLLAKHDYGVLLFDIRAHGDSDGTVLPYGGDEAEDVIGAATYLQTREELDPNKIGAMGYSLGAQISILAAAGSDQIQAVVADGPCCTTRADFPPPGRLKDWFYVPYDAVFFPMLRWRTKVSDPVSIQEGVSLISPRPLLLIGSGSEKDMIEHHYDAAKEPKELWIIPDAGHIGGLSAHPGEYENRVVTFFNRALLAEN
jgi:fermentation-respiration switch protein FrsA (DUF1100 family)